MKRFSGQARFKIIAVVSILLIFYYAYRSFTDYNNRLIHEDQLEFARTKGTPIIVAVYYEALCPDSKNFIVKQLKSAYSKLPNLIEIEFFPYGKASTNVQPDGSLSFQCQHGARECEGNIIHCCAVESIHDTEMRLNFVACMIQFAIDVSTVETIQKCYNSLHGKELLKIAGEATHNLNPSVSFIPTITLDGQQRRQATILRDLFSEICAVLAESGLTPKACESI
ncbi:hypothetical protein PVAND_005082 [Polypedilum vanderplanki]|uniref:Gamma-interferon-inducible lysosomal thiol reductase n=1 Tax=Polypedilum vanderplanki TaxID=319348 RepID=A0A9J6BZ29_POLVA|nr:hypothetical protein PVAND_005082 [Polypedilum vanderplanki]